MAPATYTSLLTISMLSCQFRKDHMIFIFRESKFNATLEPNLDNYIRIAKSTASAL